MALQSLQAMYWPGDGVQSTAPPPTLTQYPAWQAATVGTCMVLLALAGVPHLHGIALAFMPLPSPRKLRKAMTRLYRKLTLRLRLTFSVVRLVWSDDFKRASGVVQLVAGGTLGDVREPNVWGPIGQRMGATPGVGENIFRHLLATEQFGDVPNRRKHRRNLVLELAFYGLKELT